MRPTGTRKVRCELSGEIIPIEMAVPAKLLSSILVESIKELRPNWNQEGYISITEINKIHSQQVTSELREEKMKLYKEEEDDNSINIDEHDIFSHDFEALYDKNLTFGERLADKVAEFGGSWGFIISFVIVMLIWVSINAGVLLTRPFDPYPFILLNLVLSCLAAIQAPVIMMSQNRQEDKDRMRSRNDYLINLKAELEVRFLNEKLMTMFYALQNHIVESDKSFHDIQQLLKPLKGSIEDMGETPNADNSN